jgi:hypothetical protein
MSSRNWDKLAEREFNSMDTEYQEAWSDLRARVMTR